MRRLGCGLITAGDAGFFRSWSGVRQIELTSNG